MEDILKKYKAADHELPKTYLAWQMYGAGLENFGKDNAPAELTMPEPGPEELLVRIDAIGICFSDVKLITQGPAHARITGRDLQKNPTIPGHEVSATVVKIGDMLKGQFNIGDKFVVQADVYYKGVNTAYGYSIPGGMAQYSIIPHEMIEGDEGCYLLPVKSETGYAEAALTEPWACVIAAYRIKPRKAIKPMGNMLIIGLEDQPEKVEYSGYFGRGDMPGRVIVAGVNQNLRDEMCNICKSVGVEVIMLDSLSPDAVLALSQERTGAKGFDDIVVLGTPSVELAEALGKSLARGGAMDIVATKPMEGKVAVDIGRVHYHDTMYIGTTSNDIEDGYKSTRDSEFKPGGTAWFIGAAGPMGQMHVQLACMMANGPKKILATDVDSVRMATLHDKVADLAAKKGIEIIFVNPAVDGNDAMKAAFEKLTGGKGFDDIVISAPVAALVEGAIEYLGQNGVLNIFVGFPVGTFANIDLSVVYLKQARFVGSSGSRISDLADTLNRAESCEISTNASLGAIGGMCAMKAGVEAVKKGTYSGKTVIYPQIPDLPLIAVPNELKEKLPNVAAKLRDGKFWSDEAEAELLKEYVKLDGGNKCCG